MSFVEVRSQIEVPLIEVGWAGRELQHMKNRAQHDVVRSKVSNTAMKAAKKPKSLRELTFGR